MSVCLSVCLLVTLFPIESLLMCHSLHLCKVLLNSSIESSKDSIGNNSCYYMVTDGTIYIVLSILRKYLFVCLCVPLFPMKWPINNKCSTYR